MVGDGVNPLTNPFELILVRAGVETAVAAPVAVLALAWLWRRHLPDWVDAVAPVAVAGLAGWHGGCVWRGTCLGAASELPWAYGLPGSTVTRHPVEVYTAIGLAILTLVVSRLACEAVAGHRSGHRWRSSRSTGHRTPSTQPVRRSYHVLRSSDGDGCRNRPPRTPVRRICSTDGQPIRGRHRSTLTRPPGPSSMAIRPPWASTMPRAMASPRPAPPPDRAESARLKWSNARSRNSLGEAFTVVDHPEAPVEHLDPHGTARRRVPDCVVDQVAKNPPHPGRIDVDRSGDVGGHREGHASGIGDRRAHLHGLVGELPEIHRLDGGLVPARLDTAYKRRDPRRDGPDARRPWPCRSDRRLDPAPHRLPPPRSPPAAKREGFEGRDRPT